MLGSSPEARAVESALVFYSGGKEVLRVTPSQMAARPDAKVVDVADPAYGRRKRYRAVPLRSILTTAYGPSWALDTLGEVFFLSLNGRLIMTKTSQLMTDGGWVAFDDSESPGWEEHPGDRAKPAPFRVFWTGGEQGPRNGFPWPEQVVSIDRGMMEDMFPKTVPLGAPPGSPAARGWKVFSRDCIGCHAVNEHGGTVGPDLNAPKGVTTYRTKRQLRAYIRKPSALRYTKMPDFDWLSADDIEDLLSYFGYMSELPVKK